MPKCSPLIARPALAVASSITTRPAAASSGVHSEGSHPSDRRPQRSSAAGAVPPSHTSSGCCTGRGQSESNPSSSSPATSSASASGVDAPPAVPTPIRIFMISDDLKPLEPHRVIGLVPLEHLPDRRLLLAQHYHLVDPLEVHEDALA